MAVVWIHGCGANFYLPSYVGVGRALAEWLHDHLCKYTHARHRQRREMQLGQTGAWRRLMGRYQRGRAAYRRLGRLCAKLGFDRVILVGHSAGWASVGRYEADTRDPRVAGLVFASGCVGCGNEGDDRHCERKRRSLWTRCRRQPNQASQSFLSVLCERCNLPGQYRHAARIRRFSEFGHQIRRSREFVAPFWPFPAVRATQADRRN